MDENILPVNTNDNILEDSFNNQNIFKTENSILLTQKEISNIKSVVITEDKIKWYEDLPTMTTIVGFAGSLIALIKAIVSRNE